MCNTIFSIFCMENLFLTLFSCSEAMFEHNSKMTAINTLIFYTILSFSCRAHAYVENDCATILENIFYIFFSILLTYFNIFF